MASAKLVVTKAKGGSKITLIGTSGTELMSSKVFVEPRGKGATIRSLKGLLGEKIVVEDHTVATATATAEAPVEKAPTVPAAKRAAKSPTATKAPRAKTARAASARATTSRAKTPPATASRAKAARRGRQSTKSA